MSLAAAVWLIILSAAVMANLPFAANRPVIAWPWTAGLAPAAWQRWLLSALNLLALLLWCWFTLTILGGAFAGGGASFGLFALKLLLCFLLAGGMLYVPGWLVLRQRQTVGTQAALAGQASMASGSDQSGSTAAGHAPSTAAEPPVTASASGQALETAASQMPQTMAAPPEAAAGSELENDPLDDTPDYDSGYSLMGRLANPAEAKPFFDRLLELLVGYVMVGILGFGLELNQGNAFDQGWEFYAIALSLFLVLAFPGFVLRYMVRRR